MMALQFTPGSRCARCNPFVAQGSTRNLKVSQTRQLLRHSRAPRILGAAKNDSAEGIADKVTDLVRPGFVPRPVAKAILFSFGAGFVWSLVQKLFSFVIFLGLLGGGAYLFLRPKNQEELAKRKEKPQGEENDVLQSARRIMDKYK